VNLFREDLVSFFDDFLLKKISKKCLEISNQAYQVNNGNIPKWSQAIDTIDALPKGKISLKKPYISINKDCIDSELLMDALYKLVPWRKGPFMINGLAIESEWDGDMKWQRISKHIKPLKNKRVLDVGAGNGYFTLRMAMEGAKRALGIDPFLLFNYQFRAIKSMIESPLNALLLPMKLEEIPKKPIFDTVFSMGVLYHQRDHMAHLSQLKEMMAPDAEFVIETLVVEGPEDYILVPKDRYAQMRNVYSIPSIKTLKSWLNDANFNNVKVVDVSKTTTAEQRKTPWIGENGASLEDFLNPLDDSLTIEGYPAPTRAIVVCER
jgi:tRNA (mo5U34)-methyltransferase